MFYLILTNLTESVQDIKDDRFNYYCLSEYSIDGPAMLR